MRSGALAVMLVIIGASHARQRPSRPPLSKSSEAQIVFMSPVKVTTLGSRGFELVAMNLDRSNRRQLTDNDRQEFLPHFSPDGRRLVYTLFTTGAYGVPDSRSDVGVYDFETGTEINLTNTGADSYPVWSPDGSRIAFLSMRATPGPRLWMMNADGSEAHEIAGPSGSADDLIWGRHCMVKPQLDSLRRRAKYRRLFQSASGQDPSRRQRAHAGYR